MVFQGSMPSTSMLVPTSMMETDLGTQGWMNQGSANKNGNKKTSNETRCSASKKTSPSKVPVHWTWLSGFLGQHLASTLFLTCPQGVNCYWLWPGWILHTGAPHNRPPCCTSGCHSNSNKPIGVSSAATFVRWHGIKKEEPYHISKHHGRKYQKGIVT